MLFADLACCGSFYGGLYGGYCRDCCGGSCRACYYRVLAEVAAKVLVVQLSRGVGNLIYRYIVVQAGLGFNVDTGAAEAATEVTGKVAAEVLVELAGGTELKAQVKIRQPKELKVFNSPRLSVVVTAEVTSEVAAEVLAEAVAIVLLMAVRY
jgi:hypothetical protein